MNKIPVEEFKPRRGTMRARLFENKHIGLRPTLFYDIEIPLQPFDAGLDWVKQPTETEFVLDFILFPVKDWRSFDGKSFRVKRDDSDGSIYIGSAHSPVDIKEIRFERKGGKRFRVYCTLFCDFDSTGVGQSETVTLEAELDYIGLVIDREIVDPKSRNSESAKKIAARFVDMSGYGEPLFDDVALFPALE